MSCLKVSRLSFQGYTYQSLITFLFVCIMDLKREIKIVEAEVEEGTHNFDDIKLTLDKTTVNLQVKNYIEGAKIRIEKGFIYYGSSKIKVSNTGDNVLVTHNYQYEPNGFSFGFPAFITEDVTIINIKEDMLFDYLETNYISYERLFVIQRLFNNTFTCNLCKLNIDNLPRMILYSNALNETSLKVRDFKIDRSNQIKVIIGKPGSGKSHLVSFMENEPNVVLYRFWTHEDDIHKIDRRIYKNFINMLSMRVFATEQKHTEEEIIEKIDSDGLLIVVDGLDHIVNYNNSELDQFLMMFKRFESNKQAKLLILTRPLEFDLPWAVEELTDWNHDETSFYLNQMGIQDYSVANEIYQISKGYPIVVNYLFRHYKNHNELPKIDEFDDLSDYYEKLLKNVKGLKALNIWTAVNTYLTVDEIIKVLPESYGMILDFTKEYSYLFVKKANRLSLVHDSLNTYIRKKLSDEGHHIKKLKSYIYSSINNNEICFLSRIGLLNLDEEYLKSIVVKYSDFREFQSLVKNTIDVETLFSLYSDIFNILSNSNEDLLDIYKYYQLMLIKQLVNKMHLHQGYEILYEIWSYFKKNGINWEQQIFSSEWLFNSFLFFESRNEEEFFKFLSDQYQDIHHAMNVIDDLTSIDLKSIDLYRDYEINLIYSKLKIDSERYFNEGRISVLIVDAYEKKNTSSILYKIADLYIKGDESQSLSLLYMFIGKYQVESRFLKRIIINAVDSLYKRGNVDIPNPYMDKSLIEFIKLKIYEQSLGLGNSIASYLRLSRKMNKEVDYENLIYYFLMYEYRKDYSVISLPEALLVFLSQNLIEIRECARIICDFQDLSEKGIRDLYTQFVGLLSNDQIKVADELGLLNRSKYRFYIEDLEVDAINRLPIETGEIEIRKYLDSMMHRTTFSNNDFRNILNSKFKGYLNQIFEWNRIKLDDEQDNDNKTESPKVQDFMTRGYINLEDHSDIISKGISHIELAKYISPNNMSLPFADLFSHYDKEILLQDLTKIIHTSLFKSFGGKLELTYRNYYSYVGAIPKLLSITSAQVDYARLFSYLKTFIDFSLVDIHRY